MSDPRHEGRLFADVAPSVNVPKSQFSEYEDEDGEVDVEDVD